MGTGRSWEFLCASTLFLRQGNPGWSAGGAKALWRPLLPETHSRLLRSSLPSLQWELSCRSSHLLRTLPPQLLGKWAGSPPHQGKMSSAAHLRCLLPPGESQKYSGGEDVVYNRPQAPVNNWRLQARAVWGSMSLCLIVPNPRGQAGATPSTGSLGR